MSFVLDVSLALAWAFPDEQTAAALAVRARLFAESALVPAVWPFELTNGLLVGERRGRITAEESDRFVSDLAAAPITLDPEPPLTLPPELLRTARALALAAYDAAYVELAARQRLPLATLDRKLRVAASQHGVALL